MDETFFTLDADNILQENLFIVLSSVKMFALSRLMSILRFYIIVPMRWLSGKTHTLSDNYWSVKSMFRAVDFLYDAMLKLEKDGWKILDEKFMLNMNF